MDIVYVLRQGDEDCMDLRFSLRSLKNLPHGKVYIFGYKPDWLQNVVHVPADDPGAKGANVVAKYKMICSHPDITDDFVLMHDDFFILRPIQSVEYYKLGTLRDYVQNIRKRYPDVYQDLPFYHAMNKTLNMFPAGDDFDVHCPVVFNKEKFAYILERWGHSVASKRSIYCNHYGIQGVYLPHTPDYMNNSKVRDCKIYDPRRKKILNGQIYLSVSDQMGGDDYIRDVLQQKFPEKSPYEK